MTARAKTRAACDASVLLEATPFRDLLHRTVALREAGRNCCDRDYNGLCEERDDTEQAMKMRLCEVLGLPAAELALLGDFL